MASRADNYNERDMPLANADDAETWMRMLAAKARNKKLIDNGESNEITDMFLATAGMKAVRQVSTMALPQKLEEMKFKEIQELIMSQLRPTKHLLIAERTKFMSMCQEQSETIQEYAHRLRFAARHCEFQLIGQQKRQSSEDELIQMRLIAGLQSTNHRSKILERVQTTNEVLSLHEVIEIIQQLELIESFQSVTMDNERDRTSSTMPLAVDHVDRNKIHPKKNNMAHSDANTQTCNYCGSAHPPRKCPAYGKKCLKCNKFNHYSKVCKSAVNIQMINAEEQINDVLTSEEQKDVFSIGTNGIQEVNINGTKCLMQLDSGSQVTLIPQNIWDQIERPKLKRSKAMLKQFDGSVIKTLGYFEGIIETNERYVPATILVAACNKTHGLVGTDVLNFKAEVHHTIAEGSIYGPVKGFKAKIILKNNVRPSYFESRAVPIHLRDLVITALNKNIKEGIMEKVAPGGSLWASPLVIVRKPNGDIRLCGDYKVGVNNKICSDSYPIPHIETALSSLVGMSYFAKLDLTNAYNQIEMDEGSREITTLNTPIGLVRWTRLPFGIKTASAQFQRIIERIVSDDIANVVIYQDDICIGARTVEELKTKATKIINRLKASGMRINEGKSIMKTDKVSFLGHIISSEGLSPDTKMVSRVSDIKPPQNRKQLKSFLGLVNFYSKFIDHFSDKIEPLNVLRSNDVDFIWGPRQQKSFDDLKAALTKPPLIRIYDPRSETTLTTDASEDAIAAVLTQDEHPVLYLSRRLSKAERNYSNIEREALAIVWATHRARDFLIGKKFTLRTDHKPLEFLLHPCREIPKVTSARLMRWALQLSAFDYEILYVKGENIPHVDALSRLEFTNDGREEEEIEEESFVHWIETDVIRKDELRSSMNGNKLLNDVSQRIQTNRWSQCSMAERPFKMVRQKLSVQEGLIFNGDVIVPPPEVRSKFIAAVHNDIHGGVKTTINRLKLEAWWPGMYKDVERAVVNCKCQETRDPTNKSLHKWPEETGAWERVHMDHAFIPNIGIVLIMVDAYSGWPEVVRVNDRHARTVQNVLRTVFSRNGVPMALVSDNAAEFSDRILIEWLENIGCRPVKTPPYHPQSNGIAERMVRTIKCGVKAFNKRPEDFNAYLSRLLLSYRTIPHGNRAMSPSALMGRQIRAPLTNAFNNYENIQYRQSPTHPPKRARFIVQEGQNTALIIQEGNTKATLAHFDQLRSAKDETAANPEGRLDTAKTDAEGARYENDMENDESRYPSRDSNAFNNGQENEETVTSRRSTRENKGTLPLRFRE